MPPFARHQNAMERVDVAAKSLVVVTNVEGRLELGDLGGGFGRGMCGRQVGGRHGR